jgi:hypothetical protein
MFIPAFLSVAVAIAQDKPTVEVFAGYTYVRANPTGDAPSFSANGGSGQFVVNFNRWVGFVADLGAVHNGNISDVHRDSTFAHYLFGPRVSIRNQSRVTPFVHYLMGGVHAGTSKQVTATLPPSPDNPIFIPGQGDYVQGGQVSVRALHSQTAFGFALGGGFDIKINRWVSFRPAQVDWYFARLQNVRTLQDNNQHNLRYTTGFNFTIGGEQPSLPPPPPPAPAMRSCWDGTSIPMDQECPKRRMSLGISSPRTDLCPGETSLLTPAGTLPPDATVQWTVNDEAISQGPSFDFGATGRQAGTYRVGATVAAPGYEDSSAQATLNVLDYQAPAGTLQVNPPEVWQGERATLSANFSPGRCGGALGAPSYKAAEGAVQGNEFDSTAVQFDPADNREQRKTVRLSARVADERGFGNAETDVVVKKRPALMARRLPDIVFAKNAARVNNCGARILLEELKTLTAGDSGGRVVFVGHLSATEGAQSGLDVKRALNAAAMISAGKGVCHDFPASQILVAGVGSQDNGVDFQSHFCGTSTTPVTERPGQQVDETDSDAKYRRVEVWFVPSGGTLPESLKTPTNAATLAVAALGCPR